MRIPQRITALTSSAIAAAFFFSTSHVAFAQANATDTWTGNIDTNWATAGNWTGGNTTPQAGDSLVFGSTSGSAVLNNNLTAGTAIYGIDFSGGSAFTLNGNGILLSGQSYSPVSGITNNSGLLQTFGTLPITLDSGDYAIIGSGGNLALNGGLTPNTGGVAIFDPFVTSTFLTNDSSGLIAGLGGAGLTYSGSGSSFTGLATMSGTSIATYSGWPSVISTPGVIGATTAAGAQNIELTATTTGNYTLAGGTGITYANTIFLNNATSTNLVVGSTIGSQTLDMGAVSGIGGFYVLAGNTAQALTVGSGSSTILTAGPETGSPTPGTIVFAINGTSSGNQAEINCSIQNNGSGGPVSLVKTGPGSMFFNGALTTFVSNTFTGGIYVNEGQFQFGNAGCLSTGPIYIASGGSVYFNNAVTITNNIFLSPGADSVSVVAGGAGLIFAGSGTTLKGTLTLQGEPVSPPSSTVTTPTGDTFSGNGTDFFFYFPSQITGTGTLELTGAHTYYAVFENTNTVTPNNWQGGLIIGGHGGSAVNVLAQMGATNQIPSGPNTGNISFIPAESSGNSTARFDLFGFNTSVNGLNATTSFATTEAQLLDTQGSCTLTMGANNSNATFNGSVIDGGNSSHALSLVKIGTGTQTFGGPTNTIDGNITVNAGTLAFTGSATLGNVPVFTVANGATLDCSGLNVGGLTVGAGKILNCVGAVKGSTTIYGTVEALDAIGTLTNNGNLTFGTNGTYVWDVNNFTGTQGGDPGWNVLNVQGGLTVSSTTGSPFNIDITSLTSGDVPGNAANFNSRASGSWIIATTTTGISGFAANLFSVSTSAFSNSPTSSSKWSVGVSNNNLVLNYVSVSAIANPLVNQTNNAGTTATFTVGANLSGVTPPLTYQWEQGSTPVVSGSTAAGGGTITITTNTVANTSTLTIANVQDADAAEGISVTVSDNFGDSGSSSATLTVIDPPSSPSITQTNSTGIAAGGVVGLIASANGTAPFTYAWFLNGVALTNNAIFSGTTSGTLNVDLGAAQSGNYTVVISNGAGSVTNSQTLGPVTVVPGQIIYEPFTSYVAQSFPPGGPDTWENMTNLYNELTGSPAWWFHSSGSGVQMVVYPMDLNNGNNNQNGGTYPWPGLAGNSTNELYWTTSLNSHLEFGQIEGFPPGSKVYVSFELSLVSLGSANGVEDVIAGFTTSDSGTAFNLKICTIVTNYGADQVSLGIAKGSGVGSTQTVDTNTIWEPSPILGQQTVFVVACYTVVSGGTNTDDTVSMWVNPSPSTFYAGEANVPAPDVGPASFGVPNSVIRDFAVHAVNDPASHRIADLRIGTTWASVTPPSAPTLYVGNVYAPLGTTAVFASQNAGNPVTQGYGWQFNGGPALSDGPTGHGSYLSGSLTGTLTISNVQSADLGTYTVNGTNTDLSTNNAGALTGTASAILSSERPTLSVLSSAPGNVLVAWPTNWTGFVLEQAGTLVPASWTTNSLPPYPVVGTNNAVTVPVSGTEFFQLINP